MKKYIEVVDNKIHLYKADFPISPFIKLKPFTLNIDNIMLVAWGVRMLGDDEEFSYILVDKHYNIFPISYYYLRNNDKFLDDIETYFNIPDYKHLTSKLNIDAKQTSVIIYPEKLFGKPLYKENFSGVLPFLHSLARSFMCIKLGKGILTDECKQYLQKHPPPLAGV